ncbi:DUF6804 family protein [Sphingomonas sp. 4RDLI-65]|uniref:DUF6804 family protein n=1 Tax=Sphingomonas sp. 4RDLI-65 TaxID=3111641 RepID=UPI003C1FE51B
MRFIVWIGPIVCLAVALGDMPYGYYQLLRIVIFCAAVYLAIIEKRDADNAWLWAFVACALVYNPLVKLALGREVWAIVNIGTIALFLIHMIKRRVVVQ